MFQLSQEEFKNWRSQNVTSNSDRMGLRRAPYAFTEQGVYMLATVLKSDVAIDGNNDDSLRKYKAFEMKIGEKRI